MPADAAYERHRDHQADLSRERSRRGRDIGRIPPVANPDRRAHALTSLQAFCETYGRGTFRLGWSPDHLLFLANVETVLRHGGRLAQGMPRGAGKTAILEWGVIFGAAARLRRYIVFIGSTSKIAESNLGDIKSQLESNSLLLEDFPEICYPILRLEGMPQRCHGQLCEGQRTHIAWSTDRVVLPHVPARGAMATVIDTASVEGAIRGRRFTPPDGGVLRPDVIIIDDPQTRESARSPQQTALRELIIEGDAMGLGGPDVDVAGFMGCTVIERGDLADRFLDRKQKPEWRGVRCRAVRAMPANIELWDRWARTLRAELDGDRDAIASEYGREARAFYLANRAEMDRGAELSWPERKPKSAESGLEAAMRTYYFARPAFFAELQNEPEPVDSLGQAVAIDAGAVIARVNGCPRGTVPEWGSRLTAFVDVQQTVLYWLVCAWADDFTGAIIEYGTFPEQRSDYFTLAEVRRTLQDLNPRADLPGQIRAGLVQLVAQLGGKAWPRKGAVDGLRVERIMIDSNWGKSDDVVRDVCASHDLAGLLLPSKGRGIGAADRPMREYQRRQGERVGLNWRIPVTNRTRYLVFDTNWWKSFVADRLSTAQGDKGSLTLPGKDPQVHRMLADQLAAENPIPVESRGRRVDEWRLRRPGLDNHYFDCLVGCAVAASERGCVLPGSQPAGPVRRRVRFSELAAKRGGR